MLQGNTDPDTRSVIAEILRLDLCKTVFSEKSLKFKNSFYNYLKIIFAHIQSNELLNDGTFLDIFAFWCYGVVNHTTTAISYKYLYTIGSCFFLREDYVPL